LGCIIDHDPGFEALRIGKRFLQFVENNASQLRRQYGLQLIDQWKADAITVARAPNDADPRLAYIHLQKLDSDLVRQLCELQLGSIGEGRDGNWLGVHPKLADVYMTSLAESIALTTKYSPVADRVLEYLGVGGLTFDRLASLLLGRRYIEDTSNREEIATAVAISAIRAVVPRRLHLLSIEEIIRFRKQAAGHLFAFQQRIHQLCDEIPRELTGISDPDALQEHVNVLSAKLMPEMDSVENELRSLGIETVMGAFTVKSPLPRAAAAGALLDVALSQPLYVGAGIALGLAAHLHSKQKEAQQIMQAPAAYLLIAKHRLQPQTLIRRIQNGARKVFLGV
jgi:hypothetical protein